MSRSRHSGNSSLWLALLLILAAGLFAAGGTRAGDRRGAGDSGAVPRQDPQISEDWVASATEEIKRLEYHFSRHDGQSWSAPNRANDLRVRVSESGVEVTSRTKGADPKAGGWTLSLALASHGRAGSAIEAMRALPEADGARALFRRGPVTEWYLNDDRGIEQGFTLAERSPAGEIRGAPVVLEMRLGGDLTASLTDDGGAVLFRTSTGEDVLKYDGLKVEDSSGRRLGAWLALASETLEIRIDDEDAVYPVMVDPLLSTPSWTGEVDKADARFGISVASAGDVNGDGFSDVIIGAYKYDGGLNDEGRAFVWLGSATGLGANGSGSNIDWFAEVDQAVASFGNSVASAGDVNGDGFSDVIIGAYQYNGATEGEIDEGRAFAWYGSATGLGANGTLANADWVAQPGCCNELSAALGFQVASAGDVNGDGFSDVIVGAYNEGAVGEGKARVFHGSATGLSTTAAWTVSGPLLSSAAQMGYSVASAGDVNGDGYSDVIVGVPNYDNPTSNEGRVFVYHGSATGLDASEFGWAWSAESDQADARFGSAVNSAGDVNGDGYSDVIITASKYDSPTTDEGKVFVWFGGASGLGALGTPANADWTAEVDLVVNFGGSVATVGDVNGDGYSDIGIGASGYTNGESGEGRAFIWFGGAGGPGPNGTASNADWTAESNQASAAFGRSIATAGDVNGDGFSDVIVGAELYQSASNQADEGRAFVYHGSSSGLGTTSAWFAENNQAGSLFGRVASAGDVNGDGYSDVIVGAPWFNATFNNEGRALVYHGSASGLVLSGWTADGGQADAAFGSSVATAGDVNGDGYSDVIVGAWEYDGPDTSEGRAVVYHGSASGLGAAAWSAESDQNSARLGYSVGTAGDVNGDGFSDVIIGAHAYDNPETDEGAVFVWHGSATGLGANGTPANADWSAESNQSLGGSTSSQFGVSVASAGDVNGDGFSDIIVGAPYNDNGHSDEGRAFVWHGSATGLGANGTPTNADWRGEGNLNGGAFGYSVAGAGDVNGDRFSDIVIGAPLHYNTPTFEGRVFVYLGASGGLGADGTPTNADWSAESNQNGAWFGFAVGTSGDVNGDGFSDVIVGAANYDNPEIDEGRAFIWHGSGTGLGAVGTPANAAWAADTNQAGSAFGGWLGMAGDVNGDGFSDVIVGAQGFDDGASADEGRVFVYYGNVGTNGTAGVTRTPMQLLSGGSAPIALLGMTDGTNQFRLRLIGRTPVGRGKVRLEWEVKPLATAFNGAGLGQGAIVDTGAPGSSGSIVTLEETISGLSASTVYKWRVRTLWSVPGTAYYQRSPWYTLPGNGRTEADLRTGS